MSPFSAWYQTEIVDWVTNPIAWQVPGIWAQMIGVMCLMYVVFSLMDNRYAGGSLFDSRGAHIATIVAGVYVLAVFVVPFIDPRLVPGLILLAILAVIGFVVYRRQHRRGQPLHPRRNNRNNPAAQPAAPGITGGNP